MMNEFSRKVLDITKRIPEGRVATYADIARAAGSPKAARAAGSALRKNKDTMIIPCHRVIRSDGSIGSYSGKMDKLALLRSEGVEITNHRISLKKFRADLDI